MSLIYLYLKDMLLYILMATPLYILLRIVYLKIKKSKIYLSRELLLAICFLYLVGFFSQTVLPPGHYGLENGKLYIDPIISGKYFNIIPFKTLQNFTIGTNNEIGDWEKVSILNLMANILLFVPIGFTLPLLRSTAIKLRQVIVAGIILSVTIEFAQFFLGRRADIDDLILNVLGIIVGYAILKIVEKSHFISSKILRFSS